MLDLFEDVPLLVQEGDKLLPLGLSPHIDHDHISGLPGEIGENRVFREINCLGLLLVVIYL